MFRRLIGLGFLLFSACGGPAKITTDIRFPYEWLGSQGFGGNIDQYGVTEPSGICFHPTRKTLFVVSDEGHVVELTTDGAFVSRSDVPGDLEGITVDPRTGLLYIIVEGREEILEFDPARQEVTRLFPIDRAFGGNPQFLQKQTEEFDNGIEDLAFVPDKTHPHGGTFYASNQWDPPCILEVFVPLRSREPGGAPAKIVRVLPFRLDDPAALFFDTDKIILNVVSDADNILVEISLDGHLVNQYAFPGDNQEGITRDDEGYLYIAQDSGGIIKIRDLRFRQSRQAPSPLR